MNIIKTFIKNSKKNRIVTFITHIQFNKIEYGRGSPEKPLTTEKKYFSLKECSVFHLKILDIYRYPWKSNIISWNPKFYNFLSFEYFFISTYLFSKVELFPNILNEINLNLVLSNFTKQTYYKKN